MRLQMIRLCASTIIHETVMRFDSTSTLIIDQQQRCNSDARQQHKQETERTRRRPVLRKMSVKIISANSRHTAKNRPSVRCTSRVATTCGQE